MVKGAVEMTGLNRVLLSVERDFARIGLAQSSKSHLHFRDDRFLITRGRALLNRQTSAARDELRIFFDIRDDGKHLGRAEWQNALFLMRGHV